MFTGIRNRWTKDVINTRIDIVDRINKIADNMGSTSLQFILNFEAVTCVIPGIRNLKQLQSNIKASDYVLSKEKHDQIEALYENYIKDLYTPW